MNPSAIAILLHLGAVIHAIKDVTRGLEDLIQGKATGSDAQSILSDISDLFTSGLVSIPGLTEDQLRQIIADLSKSFG